MDTTKYDKKMCDYIFEIDKVDIWVSLDSINWMRLDQNVHTFTYIGAYRYVKFTEKKNE